MRQKLKQLWKSFVHELKHLWNGFRLLGSDIYAATGLLRQVVRGQNLTRRERRQLIRTTSDMFRLVPFLMFIIIPMMEFLLPLAIKIFPNMLPSTFQTKHQKAEKYKKQLKLRLDLASFMIATLKEIATKISDSQTTQIKNSAKDFLQILDQVKRGESVDNKLLLQVAKLFEDEITIDSLSRDQLNTLCRYMGLRWYGSDVMLRRHLFNKLDEIKRDDKEIMKEGLDSLSSDEVESACRDRGMRVSGLHEWQLRRNLSSWLDLSLNYNLPPSLLVLSRTLTMPMRYAEPSSSHLADTVAALSGEALDEVRVEKLGLDDIEKEREIVRRQSELIQAERQEKKEQIENEILQKKASLNMNEDEEEDTAESRTIVSKEQKKEAIRDISQALSSMMSKSAVEHEKDELAELNDEYNSVKFNSEDNEVKEEEEIGEEIKQASANSKTQDSVDKNSDNIQEVFDEEKINLTEDSKLDSIQKEKDSIGSDELEFRQKEIDQQSSSNISLEENETEKEVLDEEIESNGGSNVSNKVVKKLDSQVKTMLESIRKQIEDADVEIGQSLNVVKNGSKEEFKKVDDKELNSNLKQEESLSSKTKDDDVSTSQHTTKKADEYNDSKEQSHEKVDDGEETNSKSDEDEKTSLSLKQAEEILRSNLDRSKMGLSDAETSQILRELDLKKDGKLDIDELEEISHRLEDRFSDNTSTNSFNKSKLNSNGKDKQ